MERVIEFGPPTQKPCGGGVKGIFHIFPTNGKEITIHLLSHVSRSDLKCRIAIDEGNFVYNSKGIDNKDDFIVLKPLLIDSDETGAFACGKIINETEHVIFHIPDTIKTRNCTIQLSLIDSNSVYYSCSDVIFYNDAIDGCLMEYSKMSCAEVFYTQEQLRIMINNRSWVRRQRKSAVIDCYRSYSNYSWNCNGI